LGAVASDHLGDRPVLAVGDQDTFAEDLGFQVGAGLAVDVEGEWGRVELSTGPGEGVTNTRSHYLVRDVRGVGRH
jgi:hypothetical protein